MRRSAHDFYPAGVEIPQQSLDRYRCVDAATKNVLLTARRRIVVIMAALVVCFAVIIGRLFQLTIVDYHVRNFKPSVLRTQYETARKNIVDRNGIVLATSLPTVDLSVNPRLVKNPAEAARRLVEALPDLEYDDVYDKLSSPASFKYIKRNLTPKERNSVNWLGYYFLQETKGEKRAYPQGRLFAHILGATDIDNHGIAGLEKSYEAALQAGEVRLSLDTSVQEMTRQTLQQGVQKYQAAGGLGIVMDVRNGEVLALVSLPDYDPNLAADGDEAARFNKAVLGTYEFGSVFKLFNTAMGLDYKDIRVGDRFDASQPIRIGRKDIKDYRGENRMLSVAEILMHSSNIGSVLIAQKSGWEKQRDFLKRFGFFERLPIQLPERGWTQYPQGKRWADITSANVAFGYGISVTPLHLIAGVAALVNGGYYRVPTFIRGGNDAGIEYQVIQPETSEAMRRMMWAVINWDIKAKDPVAGYAVGGKTGSANLLENGKYVRGALRTTFVGAFPMDHPRYAVLVTLEDPKRIKETWMFNTAGWNAKPVGMSIIAQIAPYLGVAPRERWEQPAYIQQAIEESLQHKKR